MSEELDKKHDLEDKSPNALESAQKDSISEGTLTSEVEGMMNHRRLTSRQIQLCSIAGTIGSALFVAIGTTLRNAGPAPLLMGMITWCSVIFCVAQCQIEMVTLHPLDGSFIRFAGRFVDEALSFATGWNYAFAQAALVCFDISIFTVVVSYWEVLHPAILTSVLIACFFFLNVWSVAWFGEAEFFAALGKVILVLGMLGFTIVTMLGGNPQGDRFGFRYWNDPGAFNQFRHDGALGRFEAYVQAVIGCAFIVAGPEYISMVAGEAVNPRKVMPRAFKSIIYRLLFFFLGGALSVGVLVPFTSPELLSAGGAPIQASPYIIAMRRMGITVLPDIVNALLCTSIFSAANASMYGASRSLYALALKGQAPQIFTKLNRKGNPYLCVCAASAVSCLSYLSVSAGTSEVITYWVSIVTASQLINWIIMSTTWLRFNNAISKQGLDRQSFLPYRSRFQPFSAWYALVMSVIVLAIQGYTTLLPGSFDAVDFIVAYIMVFVVIFLIILWKFVKRTTFHRGVDVDLTTGLEELDEYTLAYETIENSKPLSFGQRLSNAIF